jgi:hypothetical protein
MTKIIVGEDCGNSPKNILLQNLTIAFGKVTDDFHWNIVGNQLIQGKDDFAKALQRKKTDKVVEMAVHHIATHGKCGAANGTTKLKNGQTLTFCDGYELKDMKGALVKEITSYIIEIKCNEHSV